MLPSTYAFSFLSSPNPGTPHLCLMIALFIAVRSLVFLRDRANTESFAGAWLLPLLPLTSPFILIMTLGLPPQHSSPILFPRHAPIFLHRLNYYIT